MIMTSSHTSKSTRKPRKKTASASKMRVPSRTKPQAKPQAKLRAKARAQPEQSRQPHILWRLMRGAFTASLWGGVLFVLGVGAIFVTLPDPIAAIHREVRQPSMTLLDRHGNVISHSRGQSSLTWKLEDMPPLLPATFIAVEDRRFYEHWGIDPWGILRAMLVNLRAGRFVQGGSTITQQLAKNLFLSSRKNLWRKAQEAVLALWLESLFSKEQLLEIYLNRLYLGSGVFGVGAAAQQYFQAPVPALGIPEIALLAGLPKAPSRYNPLANPQQASMRSKVVLQVMRSEGLIDEADYQQYRATLNAENLPVRRVRGQYFDVWLQSSHAVYDQINTQQDVIIHTTLDMNLQHVIETQVEDLRGHLAAKNVGQLAVISLGKQGAVRAMLGGISWQNSQFNRTTQAYRQVGSLFKLVVYAVALEHGLSPDSVITLPAYNPTLYDGWWPEKQRRTSPISMRLSEGMAQSSNLMAVHLSETLGRDKVIAMARRLGISTDLPDLPSLALGVAEIPLLQISQAFHTIANGGIAYTPHGISSISTSQGKTLYTYTHQGHRVLSAEVAAQLSQLLGSVIQEGTGKNARSMSIIGGKTGTTNDYRDALFVGYGKHITTGVWMGNDNGAPMQLVAGGGLPAQLSFMISRIFPH